jgi:hypothetical protein
VKRVGTSVSGCQTWSRSVLSYSFHHEAKVALECVYRLPVSVLENFVRRVSLVKGRHLSDGTVHCD